MTSRQQKLLKELLQHSEYRTLNEYAHFFGTSGKTISKDLDALETVIQQVGAKLIRKQGVGVKLKMSPQQAMALHQLLQESATMEDCDTGMRRLEILLRLLLHSSTYFSIQQLSEEYMVSRTSITHDLMEVEKNLALHHIELSKDYKGTKIKGREADIRKALAYLLPQYGQIMPEDIQTYQRIRHQSLELEKMRKLFEVEKAQFFEKLLNHLEIQMNRVIYEPYYTNLLTHLMIMTARIQDGKGIQRQTSPPIAAKAEEPILYESAEYLIDAIQSRFQIQINHEETHYIYKYLLSIGLGYEVLQQAEGTTSEALPVAFTKTLIYWTQQLMPGIEHLDQQLYRRLLLHIKPMLNRLKYNIRISNPLLDEFYGSFKKPLLYMKIACYLTARDYGLPVITDDEVAYLLSYVLSERERQETDHQWQVAVVCHSGYGTSQLLATRLQKAFQNIQVKEIWSSSRAQKARGDEVDFIVSTIPLESPIPHLFVSAFLSEADKANVEAFLKQGQKLALPSLEGLSFEQVASQAKPQIEHSLILDKRTKFSVKVGGDNKALVWWENQHRHYHIQYKDSAYLIQQIQLCMEEVMTYA